MKKRLIRFFACSMLAGLLGSGLYASAAEGTALPSLFHNDEAWYKDNMAPLLMKDGRYHIPADILTMFSDLSLSYGENEENLLIQSGDGTYVSILYSDKTAIVNGSLVTDVQIFREDGYDYMDAEWIASVFGLTVEYAAADDGRTILRLMDGEASRGTEELLLAYKQAYAEEVETGTAQPEETPADDTAKRIYLVTDNNYANPDLYAAEALVENSGLVCTVFIHGKTETEDLYEYAFGGNGGICASSAAEADAVNEMLGSMFLQRLSCVLPASEDTDRDALRQAGYVVVEPDFTVNYSTDPDRVYEELLVFLETEDTAVVKISGDGCSQRMVALLCDLTADPTYYRTELLIP